MCGLITRIRCHIFLPPSPAARPENSKVTKEPLHGRAPRPAVCESTPCDGRATLQVVGGGWHAAAVLLGEQHTADRHRIHQLQYYNRKER